MDYLETMAISVILIAIKEAFKNPKKSGSLKKALIKIRNQINILYPGEE